MNIINKIKLCWEGLNLKPRRMIGDSPSRGYVIWSCHPPYSLTWLWVIYWDKPAVVYWKHNNKNIVLSYIKYILTLGLSFHKQDIMLKDKYKL